MTALARELTGETRPFHEIADAAKLEQATGTFAPEVERLRRVWDGPDLERSLSSVPIYRTYVRPTATVTPGNDAAHTGATLSLGAILRVSKKGHYVTTLSPSEGYYDSGEIEEGSVGHLIGGQSVSHVTVDTTPARNIWAAVAPDIEAPHLKRIIDAGNKTIPLNKPELGMVVLAYLAREYLRHPPPAEFNLRVQPLLLWIWIGALIVFGGGLIAFSPTPRTVVRRVSVRVARRRAAGGLAEA